MSPHRIGLIATFIGQFPAYFPYFLQSCAHNPTVDFLIFTDADILPYDAPPNVRFQRLTLKGFNELATWRFGFPVKIDNAYKLCDLKPMYGFLYEEHLRRYTHWGHFDIDMILGRLSCLFTPELLAENDIISSHPAYMSGALSIYRNTPAATRLFMQSRDWKRVLADPVHSYFDEAGSVIERLWHGEDIAHHPGNIESMSHVIRRGEHGLRVRYAPIISEKIQHKIQWSNGRLMDGNRELAVFHYLIYKGRLSFNVPPYRAAPSYVFTQHGFFTPTVKSYTWDWGSSVVRNVAYKVKRRLKRK